MQSLHSHFRKNDLRTFEATQKSLKLINGGGGQNKKRGSSNFPKLNNAPPPVYYRFPSKKTAKTNSNVVLSNCSMLNLMIVHLSALQLFHYNNQCIKITIVLHTLFFVSTPYFSPLKFF